MKIKHVEAQRDGKHFGWDTGHGIPLAKAVKKFGGVKLEEVTRLHAATECGAFEWDLGHGTTLAAAAKAAGLELPKLA